MRRLEHALAGTTILVGGMLLLVLGGPRAVEGARVHVPPGTTVRSLRVMAVAREADLEAPLVGRALAVVRDGRVIGQATSGAQGEADLVLDAPVDLPATLRLRVGDREEALALVPAGTTTTAPSLISVTREGDLRVDAALERGAIVSPFAEALVVTVADALGSPVDADVVTEVEGGAPPTARVRAMAGKARFEVRADEPLLRVTVAASDGAGRRGTARGEIRALLGPCVLVREGRSAVKCPGARSQLFYSSYAGGARTGGGVVSLAPDAAGFVSGELPTDVAAADTVVLAGDAAESGAATIAWPLPGHAPSTTIPRLGVGGETLSAGWGRETSRRAWVRVTSSIVLALGLAASLLLALRRAHQPARGPDNAPDEDAIPRVRDRSRSRLQAVPLVLLLAAAGVAVALLLGTR